MVVRNLPPTLGLDAFQEVLHKHVAPDSYTWLQYYPGKIRCPVLPTAPAQPSTYILLLSLLLLTTRPNQPTNPHPFPCCTHTHSLKRTVFSRAFINFNTPADVAELKARFEGHLFVSARGTQYRCDARRERDPASQHTAAPCSWLAARARSPVAALGRTPPQQQPPQGTHPRRCAAVLCGAAQVHCRVCTLPEGPLYPHKEAAHGGHNRERWVRAATAHLLFDPGSPLLMYWQGPVP